LNPFLQKIVNLKVQNVTTNELLKYAQQYQVALSESDAKKIVVILKKNKVDIFDIQQRKRVINNIATEVNPTVAKSINKIIEQLIS
jgi:hypothetical protein